MLYRLTFTFLLFFNFKSVFSQIVFLEITLDSAITLSKNTKKKIFMDCFTTWCGPCKMLDKTTFKDQALGEFINNNYIALKKDMGGEEGIEISSQYNIKAYPTMLIIDETGKIEKKIVGFKSSVNLLNEIQEIVKEDFSDDLQYYKTKFHKDKTNPILAKKYISLLSKSDLPFEMLLMDYLDQNIDSTENKDDKLWFFDIANYYNSYATRFIIENKNFYETLLGIDSYNNKLFEIIEKSALIIGTNKDETTKDDILSFIKTNKFLDQKLSKNLFEMTFLKGALSFDDYAKECISFYDKYNYGDINQAIQFIKLNCKTDNCNKYLLDLENIKNSKKK